MNKKDQLVFLPLGGVGEIGMNFAAYGFGPDNNRRWIIVDMGVTFAGDDLPGINLILPKIDYILENGKIEGIVITHAHEDHYGGVLSLWPRVKVPIFCTAFTAGLLEAKQVAEKNYNEKNYQTLPINIFKAGDRFQVGDFEIEAVGVCHSIPEPVSLVLRSPLGNVLHSGDWKLDKSFPTKRFQQLGDEGILALVCDSTNAMREGKSQNETDVCKSLTQFIAAARGRVFISTFSSHVERLHSVVQAAHKHGRQVMLLGRALQRVALVAKELGYFDGLPDFVCDSQFAKIARNKLVVMCTGSQGEPRAALNRLSLGTYRYANLNKNDMVIFSSRIIPGNERAVLDIHNRLVAMGVDIVLDGEHGLTHISGHPRRDELKKLYSWVRPEIAIPVHGEARHLAAHAKLMQENGIKQVCPIFNGSLVRLAPKKAAVIAKVKVGRLYQDGNFIVKPEESGVLARQILGESGLISVCVILDKAGNFLQPLHMDFFGLPDIVLEKKHFYDILYETAENLIMDLSSKQQEQIMKAIKKTLQAKCNELWGKRPMVDIFVSKIEASHAR